MNCLRHESRETAASVSYRVACNQCAAAAPGNLRPQTTSVIGREGELAEVQEALKAHRLVTLTGVGGVGRPGLATEVAARLADEFPYGA